MGDAMKNFFLGFLAFCSTAAFAFPGEVVEINHDTLVAFKAGAAVCTSNYRTVPFYVDYKVGTTPRRIAVPLQVSLYEPVPGAGFVTCDEAKLWTDSEIGRESGIFHDILVNNLTIDGGACGAQYFVLTLDNPKVLPDGTQGDGYLTMDLKTKAAKCP